MSEIRVKCTYRLTLSCDSSRESLKTQTQTRKYEHVKHEREREGGNSHKTKSDDVYEMKQ